MTDILAQIKAAFTHLRIEDDSEEWESPQPVISGQDKAAEAIAAVFQTTLTLRDAQVAVMVESVEKYCDEYAPSSVVWHDREGMHCSICNRTWDRDSQAGTETHEKDCPVVVAKNLSTAALALVADRDDLQEIAQSRLVAVGELTTQVEQANARAETAEQQVAQLRHVQFTPGGDNHHNALICPYCNPNKAALRTPGTVEVCAKTICARSPIGFEGWRCMASYCPLNGRTEPGSAA